MMIDVERFKTINDQFGHQTTDLYLVEFARMVRKKVIIYFGMPEMNLLPLHTIWRLKI